MKSKSLADVLQRVETWPAAAQDELAGIARDIDVRLAQGDYAPNPAEIAGIERGLRDADAGRVATDVAIEALLARLRRA
ncbi:hypothetical protein RA307_01790 [Xanthobacteraceae bacterium Astr-EGSB]|uniref:hypothetical protein n=1 Tax=Astrobacterium formosum TaxID=3069710 RepID=UPI0027B1A83E|nr:hypothetical protein [Xanthobacteraceae bacterium Astr-EGSB]